MRRGRIVSVILLLVAFAVDPTPLRADLMLSEWHLLTGVDESRGTRVFRRFDTVKNPFRASHTAATAASSATTTYDFLFSEPESRGSFLIDADHLCRNVAGEQPRCLSSGQFVISPTVDLILSVNATYAYNLGGDTMLAFLRASAVDVTHQQVVFSVVEQAITGIHPRVGVLSLQREVVLPASATYSLRYGLEVFMASGVLPGQTATGIGRVDLQLRPVPLPSTCWLLALAVPFIRRLGRRSDLRPRGCS